MTNLKCLAQVLQGKGFVTLTLPNNDITFTNTNDTKNRYMAPELLTGDEYNLKADVYSFGIVLWQMLSCQTPYAFVKSTGDLIDHVVDANGRPSIDEKWPRFIKAMLETSFACDMELRPVSITCFCLNELKWKQNHLQNKLFSCHLENITFS